MKSQFKTLPALLGLCVTVLCFQNCGQSIDSQAYEDQSSTGAQSTSTPTVQSRIIQAYNDGFGRDPEPYELDGWSNGANLSTIYDVVLNAIRNANKTEPISTRLAVITAAYHTGFGRDATPDEITSWNNNLLQGMIYLDIRAGIRNAIKNESVSTRDLTIKAAFYNVFCRSATLTEQTHWRNILLTQQGADYTYIENRIRTPGKPLCYSGWGMPVLNANGL